MEIAGNKEQGCEKAICSFSHPCLLIPFIPFYSSSFIRVITMFSAPTSVLRFTMSSIWAR